MGKHDKTLRAIFARPTPANIAWADIAALLNRLGARVTQGAGSRVRVELNGVRYVFHTPHPQKEAGRLTVRDVREFLEAAGIQP